MPGLSFVSNEYFMAIIDDMLLHVTIRLLVILIRIVSLVFMLDSFVIFSSVRLC